MDHSRKKKNGLNTKPKQINRFLGLVKVSFYLPFGTLVSQTGWENLFGTVIFMMLAIIQVRGGGKHSLSLSHTHTLTHTLLHFLSLSLSHPHTQSLSHTHTNKHTHS